MKKQLLLLTLLLTAVIITKAQKPDTAQVIIHYKFTHIRDTTNPTHPYTENMALYIGKFASAYRSWDYVQSRERFKQQVKEAMALSSDGNISVNRMNHGTQNEYYQYPNDKTMLRLQSLFGDFLINDTLPNIAWQISSDTLTIGGLHCQKATTHFKGRDYTAWFCPDLPLRIGPWELNGLPGVIVEAYDAKNQVVFKFDGIEKATVGGSTDMESNSDAKKMPTGGPFADLNVDPNIILPPANAIKTTAKEFARLQKASAKDPTAFAQSMADAQHAANTAPGAQDHGPDRIMVKAGIPEVINNPIELPEKGSN